MTIEQAQTEKQQLEKDICSLVVKFGNETGLAVQTVELTQTHMLSGEKKLLAIKVFVEL